MLEKLKEKINKIIDTKYIWPIVAMPIAEVIGVILLLIVMQVSSLTNIANLEWLGNVMVFAVYIILTSKIYRQNMKISSIKRLVILSILTFLLSVICSTIAVGVFELLSIPVETSSNQQSLEVILENVGTIKFAILVVMAGLVEEYVYRYGVMNLIRNKTAAFIIASLIFAGIHVSATGINELIMFLTSYLPFSIWFCWIYRKYNDIELNVSIHQFYNLFTVILMVSSM